MFAQDDARLRHTVRQFLHDAPLLGGRLDGVIAAYNDVGWSDDGVGDADALTNKLLQPLRTIAHVDGKAAVHREHLIRDSFDRFSHRKHASRLSDLLLFSPTVGHPLGDESLLLLVQRELGRAILPISLLLGSEVRSEAAMCFGRHLFREPLVDSDVEEQASTVGDDVAALGRRRRMSDSPLSLVREERLCGALAACTIIVGALRALSRALRIVSGFEFMILRRGSIQLVDRGRSVVDRRRINANDATFVDRTGA
jgi:hypothetical protein